MKTINNQTKLNSTAKRRRVAIALILSGLTLLLNACGGGPKPQVTAPGPATPVAVQEPGTLIAEDLQDYLLAIQLIDKQEYEPAQKILRKLSQKNDSVTGVWANLAIACFHQQKIDEAEAAAARAYQLTPDDAAVRNLMGLLAVKRGDFKNAEAHYLKALELDDNFANAHYNLALLYDIYYQDIATAYRHYNRYLDLVGGTDKETADWVEQLKYSLDRE